MTSAKITLALLALSLLSACSAKFQVGSNSPDEPFINAQKYTPLDYKQYSLAGITAGKPISSYASYRFKKVAQVGIDIIYVADPMAAPMKRFNLKSLTVVTDLATQQIRRITAISWDSLQTMAGKLNMDLHSKQACSLPFSTPAKTASGSHYQALNFKSCFLANKTPNNISFWGTETGRLTTYNENDLYLGGTSTSYFYEVATTRSSVAMLDIGYPKIDSVLLALKNDLRIYNPAFADGTTFHSNGKRGASKALWDMIDVSDGIVIVRHPNNPTEIVMDIAIKSQYTSFTGTGSTEASTKSKKYIETLLTPKLEAILGCKLIDRKCSLADNIQFQYWFQPSGGDNYRALRDLGMGDAWTVRASFSTTE